MSVDKMHDSSSDLLTRICGKSKLTNAVRMIVLLSLIGCQSGNMDKKKVSNKSFDLTADAVGNVKRLIEEHFSEILERSDIEPKHFWSHVLLIDESNGGLKAESIDIFKSGHENDFHPASVIKPIVIIAALEKLKREGFSLDAKPSFRRCTKKYTNKCSKWQHDLQEKSFRELINDAVTCSCDRAYTTLLRYVGVDELNKNFLRDDKGFDKTSINNGYDHEDETRYGLASLQEVTVSESGKRTKSAKHRWKGTPHGRKKGCKWYTLKDKRTSKDLGLGNCSSSRNLVEFMTRLMYWDKFPPGQQFDIRESDWKFLMEAMDNKNETGIGGSGTIQCGGPGWEGVKSELGEDTEFIHKGGATACWSSDLQHVRIPGTKLSYIGFFGFYDNCKARKKLIQRQFRDGQTRKNLWKKDREERKLIMGKTKQQLSAALAKNIGHYGRR